MSDFEELRVEFINLLLADDARVVSSRAREVLDSGMDPLVFFRKVFTPAMEAIGGKFGRLEIFLPELISAADAAKAVSEEVLFPLLEMQGTKAETKRGKILIGSVRGDLHDIGKNMVVLMLAVNGYEVVDMGVDVATRDFVERALEEKVDIVGLSSLMVTSMPYMKEVVERRDGLGHKDRFAVIVGGAPISESYSKEIGADSYGEDAVDAVQKCNALMAAIAKQRGPRKRSR